MGLLGDAWDAAKDKAGAVADAVVDTAQKVETAVVDTAQQVEQKAAQVVDDGEAAAKAAAAEVQQKAAAAAAAVKQKATAAAAAAKQTAQTVADDVKQTAQTVADDAKSAAQTVADDASSAAQAVEDDASSAAQTVEDDAKAAVQTVEDDANKVVDEGKKVAQDVKDEAGKVADDVKDDAAKAKDQVVKLVSSLTGPITRILPPSLGSSTGGNGSPAAANFLGGLFGGDDEDTKCIIEFFVAQLMPADGSTDKPKSIERDSKLPKGSTLKFSWSIAPPKKLDFPVNRDDKSITGTVYRKTGFFSSRTPVGTGGPDGSCTVTFDESCDYILVAEILSDLKPKDLDVTSEDKFSLEIGEEEESGGGETTFKNEGVAWHLPEPVKIPVPYFEVEFDVTVTLSGEATFKWKGSKPDEKKEEEIRGKVAENILKKEKADGGRFKNIKLTEEEGGWKRSAEIGFENGKLAGEVGFEGTLEVGAGLSFNLKFLLLKLNSENYKVEVIAAEGGAEWSVDLATIEPVEEVELSGNATVGVGVEATPNWKEIGEQVAQKLGIEIGVDLLIPAGVFLVGVATIVGTAYILWSISDAKAQGQNALDFANGWIEGYLAQLSDKKVGKEPDTGEGRKGYEKGVEAAMEHRADILAEAKKEADNQGKTSIDLEAELSDATVKQEADIRAQLLQPTIERVRRLYWLNYASSTQDGFLNAQNTCEERLAAFGSLFSNIKPVPPAAELNQLWQQFVNSHTPANLAKTPEYAA